ncbi:unnamed protein product, partial [Prorocentrum cordatum]
MGAGQALNLVSQEAPVDELQVAEDPRDTDLHPIVGFLPSEVRVAAVRALCEVAERGDERTAAALRACAGDPSAAVRRAALNAWPHTAVRGDSRAIGAVAAGFRDADPSVREAAVRAIEHVADRGDPQAAATLTAALASCAGDALAAAAAME